MKFKQESASEAPAKLLEFHECEQILSTSLQSVLSSYQHGMLTACLCAGKEFHHMAWLEGFVDSESDKPTDNKHAKEILAQLYVISQQQLESINLDFQLLLPDDNETLHLRVKALASWCDGFIIGLKALGIHNNQEQVVMCKEALEQIAEIAQVDYEQVNDCDQSEQDYLEVYEHVRILILTIYFDLVKLRRSNAHKIN